MTISEWQTLTTGRNYMSPGEWACLLCKATFVGATTLAFAWLLANRLAGMSLDEMRSHFLSLASGQWLAAVLATVASFWAVGHYDGVIHSYLSTGARPADARKAGGSGHCDQSDFGAWRDHRCPCAVADAARPDARAGREDHHFSRPVFPVRLGRHCGCGTDPFAACPLQTSGFRRACGLSWPNQRSRDSAAISAGKLAKSVHYCAAHWVDCA